VDFRDKSVLDLGCSGGYFSLNIAFEMRGQEIELSTNVEKELFDILKEVKYLFMASKLYENAPMTLLESISLNILPIVPDLGGMKETVQDVFQFGKIYEKNNIESFIEQIEEMETEYLSELEKLIKRKSFLFENYGVEVYYKNLFNIYSDLLNKN